MATAIKTGVLAGLAIVATFALACSQGDNQCSGQEDCPAIQNCQNGVCQSGQNDGGTMDGGNPQNDGGSANGGADGGTPDGGCISLYTQQPVPCSGLNIQYVRRAVNGRYTVQGQMGIKVAILEAAACTEWVYPVTEFCLLNSLAGGSGVLPDLSTSGCSIPLDESGQCQDGTNGHKQIWLCDCNKIVGQTHDEAWPGTPGFLEWCQSWHHPSRADCDKGGVAVELFYTVSTGEIVEVYHKFLAHE